MSGKSIEMNEQKARAALKKSIGAPSYQKRRVAAQVKAHSSAARSAGMVLNLKLGVYSAAMEIRSGLEAQQMEESGALKALTKIMGAKNTRELGSAITQVGKENAKLTGKMAALQARIEAAQDSLEAADMTDTSFMDIMTEVETLPPDQVDAALNKHLKFGEMAGA